ncbi:SdpC immunity protein SpdL [Gangjinia marincola]|uniref:SdpC immunity protein SpdL n=1 Tax=Gangjinia marincola TaxID=578463 RepID=A0ABP3XTM6_9FLAO
MNQDILTLAITPTLLILLGYIYRYFPPKKINYLYGYRTRRSMANQQIWNYANKVGAKMIILWGWLLALGSFVVYLLFPNNAMLLQGILLLILMIGLFIRSERKIDQHFDKNGNLL